MSPSLRRVAGQLAFYLALAVLTLAASALLLRFCAGAVR